VRHHGLEFVLGAATDIGERDGMKPDPSGQQPADLLGHAWPHGRLTIPTTPRQLEKDMSASFDSIA